MNNTSIIADSQSHLCFPSSSSSPIPVTTFSHHNPRKRRSKLIKIEPALVPSTSASPAINARPRYYSKKPDPSAPKITKPCSECGKKFWSWKALFGHMRCHPERQWRGINPPPNHRRPVLPVLQLSNDAEGGGALMTAEDHEVASYLLMLANSEGGATTLPETADSSVAACGGGTTRSPMLIDDDQANCTRFECSSCKKVFGSHQALGGHRASHKNVKGCFAIKRSDTDGCEAADQEYRHHQIGSGNPLGKENLEEDVSGNKMVMVLGHKCGICSRVFSSGQALGGHKRCHWEKGEEASSSMQHQGLHVFPPKEGCAFDLNLPAQTEDGSASSYSSGLTLDLRLGL